MLVPRLVTEVADQLSPPYQEIEYETKKSRFIARLYPVSSKEQAREALKGARAAYPDARHHCWAYIILSGSSAAMSDDGEPSGTAGKPILNVLQHRAVSEVMVVVIRYFGGIKLGAGGLVRAYTKAAQMSVESVNLVEPIPMVEYRLEFDFAVEQTLRHLLEQVRGNLFDLQYQDRVSCFIRVPEVESSALIEKLQANSISCFEKDASPRS